MHGAWSYEAKQILTLWHLDHLDLLVLSSWLHLDGLRYGPGGHVSAASAA